MLAQKTSESLTRQTGSPTDGLDFSVKKFSPPRREAIFPLGHFASNLVTKFGVEIRLALLLTKSSPKKNSNCKLQTPGDGARPSSPYPAPESASSRLSSEFDVSIHRESAKKIVVFKKIVAS